MCHNAFRGLEENTRGKKQRIFEEPETSFVTEPILDFRFWILDWGGTSLVSRVGCIRISSQSKI